MTAEDRARRLRRLPLRRVSAWDMQHGVGALQQRTCAICLEDWTYAEQIRYVWLAEWGWVGLVALGH